MRARPLQPPICTKTCFCIASTTPRSTISTRSTSTLPAWRFACPGAIPQAQNPGCMLRQCPPIVSSASSGTSRISNCWIVSVMSCAIVPCGVAYSGVQASCARLARTSIGNGRGDSFIARGRWMQAGVIEPESSGVASLLPKPTSLQNTPTGLQDNPGKRRSEADDLVFVDFGPVFGSGPRSIGGATCSGAIQTSGGFATSKSRSGAGQALHEAARSCPPGSATDVEPARAVALGSRRAGGTC